MKKELMPPNTKKCGHEGNYSACLCGTYDALLEGVVDTPSLDKSEHDGTCRTPECYLARGNKVFDGNTGEQIREYAKPTPAVEDWEEQLIKIAEPLYDADADNQTIKIFEEKIIRYVDSLLTSLRESDRKRILKWAEKEKRHDILYFSDLVAFITNLK